jgi:pSer/pThr/pTyr-binding forkhead associated (FHA) protein
MARLLIKTEGLENRTLELHLGVNHVGRDPDCEFPIDHETVSTNHCELIVSHEGATIRDCDSTNGTFIDGEQVKEAKLLPGQTVHLGDVELFVENTDVKVAIPKFERERPKPPVMLSSGGMVCPRHSREHAIYKCTHCHEVMCSRCVHRVGRRGGKVHLLCPLCSHKCEPIEKPKKKKKTLIDLLHNTAVRLKFKRPSD